MQDNLHSVLSDVATQRDTALGRIATLEEALKVAREHVAALVVPTRGWHPNSDAKWAYAALDAKAWKDHHAAAAWLALEAIAERGGL